MSAYLHIISASDFPFQKKQFSVSKPEIPFRLRFIVAKIEFDEITILYPKKTMKIVIGIPLNLNYHWIKI